MKTIEGVEIKLGELTLMPVKHVDKYEFNLDTMADSGHVLLDDIKTSQPKLPMLFVPPNQLYLTAVTNVYYDKILMELKPANYND